MKHIVFFIFTICSVVGNAQIRWYNPEVDGAELHGQLMKQEKRSNYYHRLPDIVKSDLRNTLWDLACYSSGESLKFYTDSKEIIVKYVVSGTDKKSHISLASMSGLDLHATDRDGVIRWCNADLDFGDTITYTYSSLYYENGTRYEYELDLPLFSTVESLKIGVDQNSYFEFSNPSEELPVIAYGTSIMHGANASRPGMTWASIVKRDLDLPFVNFGFSGNGRLEKGMIDIIKENPAKLIILDCLPNLAYNKKEEIIKLTVDAVKAIRKSQPDVPIIITDHLGYAHSVTNSQVVGRAKIANEANIDAYTKLLGMGYLKLFHLTYDDIAMPSDGTVDGVHPSDYGMKVYSSAYIKAIREVLNMPKGEIATQRAVVQQRDSYNWKERHAGILSDVKKKSPKIVVFGNSIMHQWGGVRTPGYVNMVDSVGWSEMTERKNVINMGAGWDRVENVLWRVYHGALDGYDAEKIILTIGVNNLNNKDSGKDVAEGIRTLIKAIKLRQPKAELKVCGIFPMRSSEQKVADTNKLIKEVAEEEGVVFSNPGVSLLMTNGKADQSLYKNDGLHLNSNGYSRIAEELFR